MKIFLIIFLSFSSFLGYSQKYRCLSIKIIIGADYFKVYDQRPDPNSFQGLYNRFGYHFQNEYLFDIKKIRTGIGIDNSVIIQSEIYHNLNDKNIFSIYLIAGYKMVNTPKYQLFTELCFGSFLITSPVKTKRNILLKLNFTNEYFLNKKISVLIVPTLSFLHFYDNVNEYSNRITKIHSHSIYNLGIGFGIKYSFNKGTSVQ